MAAQNQLVEPTLDPAHKSSAMPGRLRFADETATPRISPARVLQDSVRRAFSPGPVLADRFSTRRALTFIAPTWLGLWAFVALVAHVSRH